MPCLTLADAADEGQVLALLVIIRGETIANLLPTAAGVVAATRAGVECLARQAGETCATVVSGSVADRMQEQCNASRSSRKSSSISGSDSSEKKSIAALRIQQQWEFRVPRRRERGAEVR